MRTFKIVAVIAPVALWPVALWGQWPDFRTSGVPRTGDGKPVLDGPAPKSADGHPDLSGIWTLARGPGGGAQARGGGAPVAAPAAVDPSKPPLATFKNIGSGFKEGLPIRGLAAELLKERKAENSKYNPDAHCLPLGLMQLHMHPQPRKIIQTPGLIVILYEAQAGIRQIFMDGRPLPNNDPDPWW